MPTGRIEPPNLDDRSWEKIKADMIARIPKDSGWTDHNASDPGITLIELFAWMSEMNMYRLNQVPEKNYIAFLNLLGITRDPPTPASVELEFTVSGENVVIPKGTQVSTKQTETEEAIVFETDENKTLNEGVHKIKASNALTINESETLGISSGEPFQVFTLSNAPLYPEPETATPFGHLQISVDGLFWTLVDEFFDGATTSYRCNPVTGEIIFGDEKFGGIPGKDVEIKAERYRYTVGGIRGNVPANTLILQKFSILGIENVTNPEAAKEGSEWEPIEETKRRAPQEIKSRDRAVTADDYEFLVKEATTDVAKVRCLGPKKKVGGGYEDSPINRNLGNVNVIFVPNILYDSDTDNRKPKPSNDLIQEVRIYLDKRRVLTSELILIEEPFYVEIAVTATIFIPADKVTGKVKTDVLKRLQNFLHPVSGGEHGQGWGIGQDLYIPKLFDVVVNMPDVSFIDKLEVKATPATRVKGVRISIEEHEIICAADKTKFNVTVKKEDAEI